MIADLKYAIRMLAKSPAFTTVAVVTLALGIGANSAIFSVVDTVLLRPLQFNRPDQLVMLWTTRPQHGGEPGPHSFPDYADYRGQTQSLQAVAAYMNTKGVLRGVGESQEIKGVAATAEIFRTLEVAPLIGRGFNAQEDQPDAPRVVVLGFGLWQRAFGGDPHIVGKQINLWTYEWTVLGVMPSGWRFPVDAEDTEFLMPLQRALGRESLEMRGSHFLSVVARLKDGATVATAQSEIETISARLRQQYPETNGSFHGLVRPLHEEIVGNVRLSLLVLLGAVALVLLIACANVANLLFVRAAGRRREVAIRMALGASRSQIVRQLLAECLLLAFLGGGAGLLLAWWSVDLVRLYQPSNLPRIAELGLNTRVCVVTLGVTFLSTLLSGLLPALHLSRSDARDALQDGTKGSTAGAHAHRLRSILVISQLAVALLLLIGAGLLIKSFLNLRATNPGFDSSRVHTVAISLPFARYPEPEQAIQFWEKLLPSLAVLPGVEAVGGANPIPFSGDLWQRNFNIVGQPAAPADSERDAERMNVDPGYFAAMNIPLRRGRGFSARDAKGAPLVVMVNEAFTRRFFPGVDPIGQHLIMGTDPAEPQDPREIVGVVGDTRHNALGQPPVPEMYLPFPQQEGTPRYLDVVLRTSTPTLTGLDTTVRNAVHSVDGDVYVPRVRPLSEMLSASLSQPRFQMSLLGVFAAVALMLAAIGTYGVIAYSVAQRTREIGVRMALGAQRMDILRMVLRQSLTLVVIGLALGLLVALGATRVMATLLYGVGANDLSTYAIVIFLLGAAALLASYIPARRAMKVDPMVALRYE